MKIREFKGGTVHYIFDNSKKDQDAAWAILEIMNPWWNKDLTGTPLAPFSKEEIGNGREGN